MAAAWVTTLLALLLGAVLAYPASVAAHGTPPHAKARESPTAIAYVYDSPSAATPTPANTRSAAFRAYDDQLNVSRARTHTTGGRLAPKGATPHVPKSPTGRGSTPKADRDPKRLWSRSDVREGP